MNNDFKTGDKVIIVSTPTIYGKPDNNKDRKKGDITEIDDLKKYIQYDDTTITIKSSQWSIDVSCLKHYKEKITNWQKEFEN